MEQFPRISREPGIMNGKAVELVVTALARYANELETGAILTIDLQKSRIRLLPL